MIVGENEVNTGTYKIKDMDKKEEYSYTLEELDNYLESNN